MNDKKRRDIAAAMATAAGMHVIHPSAYGVSRMVKMLRALGYDFAQRPRPQRRHVTTFDANDMPIPRGQR